MKKLAKRTIATMMVVVLFLSGFCIYLINYFMHGDDWAAFQVNGHVYNDGILATGTIVDINGTELAYIENGTRTYNQNYTTRVSTLHVVGDAQGNIGTGLISSYDTQLMGYNVFSGVYSISNKGNTIMATIDADVCNTAYNALWGRNGAIVVYNYKTGEIVCMVSAPGFDPLDPPELEEDESDTRYDGAYINRAVSSTFTPGSIFKAVTLHAAIETFPQLWEMEFHCDGLIEIDGDIITCTEHHGTINVEDGFARSCNIVFAELALMLGGGTLEKYSKKVGLLESFNMDSIPVTAGSFEVAANDTADLAWSGIGQYNDLVNPLAAARYMGAIANGGSTVNPRIIKNIKSSAGIPAGIYGTGVSHRLLSAATAETMKEMMRYNVTSYYGSGTFPGLEICAKSGTAEVGEEKTPHAWLVGFLDDAENPYAFAVFVENGGWGITVAGAVANTVLQHIVSR